MFNTNLFYIPPSLTFFLPFIAAGLSAWIIWRLTGNLTLPSVSHHLSVLKNAELVSAERRGQNIVYSLNATVAQETVAAVMALFKVGATARAKE